MSKKPRLVKVNGKTQVNPLKIAINLSVVEFFLKLDIIKNLEKSFIKGKQYIMSF